MQRPLFGAVPLNFDFREAKLPGPNHGIGREPLDGEHSVVVVLGRLLQQSGFTVRGFQLPSNQPLHADLSRREFQILCKLAVGRSISEIAQELSLGVKTVSTYRARVLEKMHLATNADLTTYALRNGLIQ